MQNTQEMSKPIDTKKIESMDQLQFPFPQPIDRCVMASSNGEIVIGMGAMPTMHTEGAEAMASVSTPAEFSRDATATAGASEDKAHLRQKAMSIFRELVDLAAASSHGGQETLEKIYSRLGRHEEAMGRMRGRDWAEIMAHHDDVGPMLCDAARIEAAKEHDLPLPPTAYSRLDRFGQSFWNLVCIAAGDSCFIPSAFVNDVAFLEETKVFLGGADVYDALLGERAAKKAAEKASKSARKLSKEERKAAKKAAKVAKKDAKVELELTPIQVAQSILRLNTYVKVGDAKYGRDKTWKAQSKEAEEVISRLKRHLTLPKVEGVPTTQQIVEGLIADLTRDEAEALRSGARASGKGEAICWVSTARRTVQDYFSGSTPRYLETRVLQLFKEAAPLLLKTSDLTPTETKMGAAISVAAERARTLMLKIKEAVDGVRAAAEEQKLDQQMAIVWPEGASKPSHLNRGCWGASRFRQYRAKGFKDERAALRQYIREHPEKLVDVSVDVELPEPFVDSIMNLLGDLVQAVHARTRVSWSTILMDHRDLRFDTPYSRYMPSRTMHPYDVQDQMIKGAISQNNIMAVVDAPVNTGKTAAATAMSSVLSFLRMAGKDKRRVIYACQVERVRREVLAAAHAAGIKGCYATRDRRGHIVPSLPSYVETRVKVAAEDPRNWQLIKSAKDAHDLVGIIIAKIAGMLGTLQRLKDAKDADSSRISAISDGRSRRDAEDVHRFKVRGLAEEKQEGIMATINQLFDDKHELSKTNKGKGLVAARELRSSMAKIFADMRGKRWEEENPAGRRKGWHYTVTKEVVDGETKERRRYASPRYPIRELKSLVENRITGEHTVYDRVTGQPRKIKGGKVTREALACSIQSAIRQRGIYHFCNSLIGTFEHTDILVADLDTVAAMPSKYIRDSIVFVDEHTFGADADATWGKRLMELFSAVLRRAPQQVYMVSATNSRADETNTQKLFLAYRAVRPTAELVRYTTREVQVGMSLIDDDGLVVYPHTGATTCADLSARLAKCNHPSLLRFWDDLVDVHNAIVAEKDAPALPDLEADCRNILGFPEARHILIVDKIIERLEILAATGNDDLVKRVCAKQPTATTYKIDDLVVNAARLTTNGSLVTVATESPKDDVDGPLIDVMRQVCIRLNNQLARRVQNSKEDLISALGYTPLKCQLTPERLVLATEMPLLYEQVEAARTYKMERDSVLGDIASLETMPTEEQTKDHIATLAAKREELESMPITRTFMRWPVVNASTPEALKEEIMLLYKRYCTAAVHEYDVELSAYEIARAAVHKSAEDATDKSIGGGSLRTGAGRTDRAEEAAEARLMADIAKFEHTVKPPQPPVPMSAIMVKTPKPSQLAKDDVPEELIVLDVAGIGVYDKTLPKEWCDYIRNKATHGQIAFLITDDGLAYGVNLPIHDVFLTEEFASSKFLGTCIQMVGRAGRRGKGLPCARCHGSPFIRKLMAFLEDPTKTDPMFDEGEALRKGLESSTFRTAVQKTKRFLYSFDWDKAATALKTKRWAQELEIARNTLVEKKTGIEAQLTANTALKSLPAQPAGWTEARWCTVLCKIRRARRVVKRLITMAPTTIAAVHARIAATPAEDAQSVVTVESATNSNGGKKKRQRGKRGSRKGRK